MASTKIGPQQLDTKGVFTGTDPNGWAITDYGTYKLGVKTVPFTFTKVRFENVALSSGNLPVGVANRDALKANWSENAGGNFSDFVTMSVTSNDGTQTSLTSYCICLGPTGATSYTVNVRYYVMW